MPVFPHLRGARLATNRIVTSEQVIAAAPDADHRIMVRETSAQGKDCRARRMGRDSGGTRGRIYEVKSTYILQPGPAALTDGIAQLHQISPGWALDNGNG